MDRRKVGIPFPTAVNSLECVPGEWIGDRTVGPERNACTGEGTAMLELVNDLAAGAQLFFATASASEAGFASNIQLLPRCRLRHHH